MASKKTVDHVAEELRKLVEQGLLIFGKDLALKGLKNKTVTKVYICSNLDELSKQDLMYYSKLSDIEVVELDKTNQELGFICKRPHLVSVISVKN